VDKSCDVLLTSAPKNICSEDFPELRRLNPVKSAEFQKPFPASEYCYNFQKYSPFIKTRQEYDRDMLKALMYQNSIIFGSVQELLRINKIFRIPEKDIDLILDLDLKENKMLTTLRNHPVDSVKFFSIFLFLISSISLAITLAIGIVVINPIFAFIGVAASIIYYLMALLKGSEK
jgi:hypothetical protein